MENINIYFYSLNKDMKPTEPDCLHCIVRVTGEVGGDHQQNWRTDAGQQDHQVDLEPQLIVTGLEDRESGSQSRQSQVQYCVPDVRISDVGEVFLRTEGGVRETPLAPHWELLAWPACSQSVHSWCKPLRINCIKNDKSVKEKRKKD